ncbi:MAG TPA: DUF3311 domain-containing protein [Rhodopila sp.]|uniref:DUF3311 domain-containing protein n=1 Tax=Rhodopila sp. TaxID=2480087 RepID=UPI002CD0EC61|nr:DUF3311 domain-containing protein [Rhodopila sp.]HVY18267.1 DUF3311 domain-containing protein [Rhodopila sp.]
MAPPPTPEPRRSPLRLLLILPFIAMLWVSTYNSTTPELFGFPFFYWYQLLWVIIAAAIAAIVYKVEH